MSKETTPFAQRPSIEGSRGYKTLVKTNVFLLSKKKNNDIIQYDVVMEPELPIENAKIAWSVFEKKLNDMHGSPVYMAFDGKKNAFSVSLLDPISILVKYDKNRSTVDNYQPLPPPTSTGRGSGMRGGDGGMGRGRGRGGGRGYYRNDRGNYDDSGRQKKPYSNPSYESRDSNIITPVKMDSDYHDVKVSIKSTAVISLKTLDDFVKGKAPESDESLHALTGITALLRYVPSMSFVSVGPNLFSPNERVSINGGLEIWRGFHQSLRVLRAGHLGVNVDVAATVFRRGNVKLIDLIAEVLNVESPNDLIRIRDLNKKISTNFCGANVVVTHIPGKSMRFKISKISDLNSDNFVFEGPNGKTNVTNYFKKTYGITLSHPHLPLLLKSNKSAVPIELATMCPSQRFLKRLSPDQVTDMIRATVMKPHIRSDKIQKFITTVSGSNYNSYLRSANLQIEPEPMTVKARVLDPPKVLLGNNRNIQVRDGTWKVSGRVSRPMKLYSFAFLFLCNTRKDDTFNVAKMVLNSCANMGIEIARSSGNPPCPLICRGEVRDARDLRAALSIASKDATRDFKCNCQLIFCIINKGAKLYSPATALYDEIKRITLVEMGVLSQCMLSERVLGPRLNPQYTDNLSMKINIKLGGATNTVDHIPLYDVPTLLLGADVTHAHAASVAPSVAALVASVDKCATRYYTYLSAMPARKEIITNLRSMVAKAIATFKSVNNCLPQRVIFFRDGVSSGQFAEVLNTEVAMLREALKDKNCPNAKITFVIVQKRHHVRLFPTDKNMQDRSGNCVPGTIVDDDITHPTEYDFFLQSHSGIQGTSRPTHYHVLLDENKTGFDDFQRLCYNLCFLSERATRSISMVSPAYRAHIAAFMGRLFLECDYDIDAMSVSSTSKDFIPVLRPIHDIIDKNTMYYM